MRPSLRVSGLRPLRLPLAALTLAFALPAGAQVIPIDEGDVDPQDAAAYAAITTTPVGALPPSLSARMINGSQSPNIGFRFHLGHMDEQGDFSRRNLAAGVDIPMGAATLGFTAGYVDYACDSDEAEEFGIELDCAGAFMLGANMFAPLISSPMGQGSSFMLGIDGTVGFSKGDVIDASFDDGFESGSFRLGLQSLSAAVTFPMALVVRQPGLVIAPHVRPGLGYGRGRIEFEEDDGFETFSEDVTESGTRFMFGGGVAFQFPNRGFGIEIGMQKVFIEDGDTVIGFGITFGR